MDAEDRFAFGTAIVQRAKAGGEVAEGGVVARRNFTFGLGFQAGEWGK